MIVDERDAYEILQVHPQAHTVVIQAAYRSLAALHHPDRDPSPAATRKMAALNGAYAKLRTPDRREAYDRLRQARTAATAATIITPPPGAPSRPAPAAGKAPASVMDFGRYHGWTITELARHDPDYLRWLGRHSSGIRYRAQIAAALDARAPTPAPQPARKGRR